MRIPQDRNIILWNPHTGTRVKTYVGHGYDVRDATVSSDNSKFASCGGDKQASVTSLTWHMNNMMIKWPCPALMGLITICRSGTCRLAHAQ